MPGGAHRRGDHGRRRGHRRASPRCASRACSSRSRRSRSRSPTVVVVALARRLPARRRVHRRRAARGDLRASRSARRAPTTCSASSWCSVVLIGVTAPAQDGHRPIADRGARQRARCGRRSGSRRRGSSSPRSPSSGAIAGLAGGLLGGLFVQFEPARFAATESLLVVADRRHRRAVVGRRRDPRCALRRRPPGAVPGHRRGRAAHERRRPAHPAAVLPRRARAGLLQRPRRRCSTGWRAGCRAAEPRRRPPTPLDEHALRAAGAASPDGLDAVIRARGVTGVASAAARSSTTSTSTSAAARSSGSSARTVPASRRS